MINLLFRQFNYDFFNTIQVHLEESGWKYIGQGSFRIALRRREIVIKVPKNPEGLEDNITEAFAYRKYRNNPDANGFVFAPCRLLANGCLMMPFVKSIAWGEIPKWGRHIDGGQVGQYKNRIVGYDTGFNIKHENKEAFQWAGIEP